MASYGVSIPFAPSTTQPGCSFGGSAFRCGSGRRVLTGPVAS